MSGGSGGSGNGGRSGGGSTNGEAGQLQAAKDEMNLVSNQIEAIDKKMDRLPFGSPAYLALMKEQSPLIKRKVAAYDKISALEGRTKEEKNARNLESSRQNDIMEGGKRMSNLSGYKSNAPPAYKAPTQKAEPKGSNVMPANAKKGDTWTNPYGTKFRFTGGYWENV